MTALWEGLTTYVVGAQVVNAGGLYQCTVAGQAAATGGPTGTGSSITDGTVTWQYVSAAWGLMPQGWVGKPLDQVKTDLETRLKSGPLGQSAGTEPDGSIPVGSLAGQLVAIIADGLGDLWDLAQSIYSSQDPSQATDAAQDALCSLTGTIRDPAAYSTATIACTGTPATPLAAGRVVQVAGSNTGFASTAAAVIASVNAYSSGHVQAVGDRVTVGNSVYQCATAVSPYTNGGTLTGTQTGASITDGNVTWTYLGPGTGAVDVPFQAQQLGALAAAAGALSVISTPVFGWLGAYNVLAAVTGSNLETNTELRVRREAELHSTGNAAADAIRAAVLLVGQGTSIFVTSCVVYFSDSDSTGLDSTGTTTLPPHSVLVLADYNATSDTPTEQAIANAIWMAVGAGIATSTGTAGGAGGGTPKTGTVTDAQGHTQTVSWVRPSATSVNVTANVTYDTTPGVFPAAEGTGSNAPAPDIKGAITTAFAGYPSGKNVWASAIVAAIFDGPTSSTPGATPVPGILDASVTLSANPVVMTPFERATAGTITVNLTGSAP